MILEWDKTSSSAPKKGTVIRNMFGQKYKVISKKGNMIELEEITDKGNK